MNEKQDHYDADNTDILEPSIEENNAWFEENYNEFESFDENTFEYEENVIEPEVFEETSSYVTSPRSSSPINVVSS
ncbi:6039_t:CDS:2, partial [Dentiscutata heterogama]